MFVDGRTVPSGAELDADVCIVGAGPAGIAVALQLMAASVRVVVLESGGIAPEVLAKHLDRGESVGYQYHNLMFTRARAFGGTSSRWHLHSRRDPGWMARPLDPVDFEARPSIPDSGWPFAAAHMEPYYHRAHAMSDLGPDTYETSDWERPAMRRLPLPEDRVVTSIAQLGMTSFVRYRDAFATASTVTVIYHSTVVEIQSTGEPALISLVRVAVGPDRLFSVAARYVVLAAGGIENPRLLLISHGHHPSGLGNGHDLVGRYFMDHPSGRLGLLRPTRATLLDETRLYDNHPEGNVLVQGILTLNADVVRREGLRNAGFFILPRTEAYASEGVRSVRALMVSVYRRPRRGSTTRHLRNVAKDFLPIAETAVGAALRSSRSPSLLVVRTQAEQAPDPASRITLSSERDRFGTRRVALDWRISDDDIASIRRSEDILDEELRKAGLGHIERKLGEEDPPVVFEGHHHHLGTTRMHGDPRGGVVDADGRVHGTRNLYVTGTSVFPTGGYINPTLSVVALGIRLGDHLRRAIEQG
jgi:choline dehydrogenase-like flavoprotein